jgi:diguanylate cyclase (GGDEF)-like protein/PAS domain S-box-containing protein
VAERTAALDREVTERRAAEEAVRRLNQELDARVRERTAQLESTNLALLRSEERYALAAEGANDGLWDWDLAGGEVYFSPRWKAMLGLDPDEPLGAGLDAWFSHVHPDDLADLRRALERRPLPTERALIRHEYRMVRRDGSEVWVLCQGTVVFDAEGRPVRIAGSQSDVTARKRAEVELLRSATHDPLTGLPNRALLLDRLEQAILRAQVAGGRRFALLFLDLDRFKNVNDSLGHVAGDQLLVQIAARLSACVREVDTVARLGGDEFAVVLADLSSEDQATAAAQHIQEALRAPFEIGGARVFASASIGIALGSEALSRALDLLRDADTAMYRAKSLGRARHQVFDARMHEQVVERLRTEEGLRRALDEGELALFYQPVVSLLTGAVVAAEALVRWRHPQRGLLGPDAFLDVAAESGLMAPLSAWVVRTACAQAAVWRRDLRDQIRINVNVPPEVLHDTWLVGEIRDQMARADLPPWALGVELVETSLIEGRASVIANLAELRRMRIHIAIDDFGTGYSSLSYLRRLPIDGLKIDRSFIHGVPWNANDTAICATIVAIAHTLDLEVVAEGVETREQVEVLARHGCVEAQGYYFSGPLPAADFARVVRARSLGTS